MEVILLMAVTADGKIARDSDQLVDWTGKADKKYFVRITKEAGVMIMGSKTFDTIGRALPDRKNIVMTRDKRRKSDSDHLVFTDQPPGKILEDLAAQGYTQAALIGGATINSLFARENLITQVHLTVVPTLFGTGLSLFNHEMAADLMLETCQEIDAGHILMVYRMGRSTEKS